jgi:farnesyl-diphosphate farnesyltransferase
MLPPGARLELLLAFREQVNGRGDLGEMRRIAATVATFRDAQPAERALLQALIPALGLLRGLDEADQADVCEIVNTLITGMEFDLKTFPLETSGKLVALKTTAEFEHYTYLVAGCVGPFWTKVSMRHIKALAAWDEAAMFARGTRFGQALQYTNVLRDCAKDLRLGRCYLPVETLSAHGLQPADLLKPENSARARPALLALMGIALEHFEEAQRYVLAIPRRCGRLRLACLWPVLIGLGTLERLAASSAWLDPANPAKVSRAFMQYTLVFSTPAVRSDTLITGWLERRFKGVREAMAARV